MCSPGTTALEPTSLARRPVRATACVGSACAAIDDKVSPDLTTYSWPWAGAAWARVLPPRSGWAEPAGPPSWRPRPRGPHPRPPGGGAPGGRCAPRRLVGQDVQPGAARLELELKCDRHGALLIEHLFANQHIGSRTPVRCQPEDRTAVRTCLHRMEGCDRPTRDRSLYPEFRGMWSRLDPAGRPGAVLGERRICLDVIIDLRRASLHRRISLLTQGRHQCLAELRARKCRGPSGSGDGAAWHSADRERRP